MLSLQGTQYRLGLPSRSPTKLVFPFTSKVLTQKLRTGRTVPKFRVLTGVVGAIPLRM
jgi:hypothetical protein